MKTPHLSGPSRDPVARWAIPALLALLLLVPALAQAAQVNIVQRSVNDVDGSTLAAVSASSYVDIGTTYTTYTAPATYSSYRFTHWTFDGEPATVYRDGWGRSLNPISFLVQVAATATAHYLPTSRDSDGDTVPDWYEMEQYGTLANTAASDTDGDGITLLAEYNAGSSPIYANTTQEGGVAWVDSALVTCNLAGYASYVFRSVPAGTVNQTYPVAPGTVVTTPDVSGNASFAYWTLDGVRQNDAWGRALSTFTFTMGTTDREAVAYIVSGDSDGDGVPDACEQRYYGTLANTAASDTDGDGITLLAEYNAGSSPIYANSTQEGGVAWVDSALVTCDLQAEITVETGGGNVPDGGSLSFGNIRFGSASSLTFTIRNDGGRPLTGLTFTLDGPDLAEFSVTESPVAPVAHLATTTLTVRCTPATLGAKTAAIHVASNDANENPFDIALTGAGFVTPTVTAPTMESVLAATATLGGNVTSAGGLPVLERGVVYAPVALNSDPFLGGLGVTKVATSGTTGAFTVPVTGLAPVTGYAFKAYATTSGDTGYNEGGTFTTLAVSEAWRLVNFDTTANSGNTADLADFDGDGVLNLTEFAFGTNPAGSGSGSGPLQYNGTFAGGGTIGATGQPITAIEPTTYSVDFRALFVRRKDYAAAGLTYTPQFSATLITWVDSTATPTVLADDGTHQIVSVPYPPFIGGKKARFFRVTVSLAF